VTSLGNWIADSRPPPLAEASLQRPTSRNIDARLTGGAALFGTGCWPVGFCPGLVLAALSFGPWPVALFLAAMLAGMAAHPIIWIDHVFDFQLRLVKLLQTCKDIEHIMFF